MPKLLFIRYKKVLNIAEGGEQVSGRNLAALEENLGPENVKVIYIHDEGAKKESRIEGAMYFLINYFFGLTRRKMNEILGELKSGGYDYLWIDRSVFGIIAKKARQSGFRGKIICFFHNMEPIFFSAKLPKYLIGRHVVINCTRRNDRMCCNYADTVVALNERDSRSLNKFYGRPADFVAPVMFKDRYAKDIYPLGNISSRSLCVFLGSYFPANTEGIEWFIREVYPYVNVSILIVGKGMDKLRSSLWLTPEIEIVSDAPQLEQYFKQADIMVLPIFKGSGMKVKTCECLMFGKNIIGTDEAWEGYDLDYDLAGGRCNTAAEFITKIKELQAAPAPRFNSYCREVFLEKYTDTLAPELFGKILA